MYAALLVEKTKDNMKNIFSILKILIAYIALKKLKRQKIYLIKILVIKYGGKKMNYIKVLDTTLRDGGCVNDFNFGSVYMNKILFALEQSGVDYIELGYIDEVKGSEKERTQYSDDKVITEYFLKKKKDGVKYVAMVDYGKFDITKLENRTENTIDGIRMAFHKKNWRDIIKVGKIVIEKGYEFFIQPMLTLRYTDSELIELIEEVNKELPEATGFYIVDSFGEMRTNDIVRVMHLVDHNLIPGMILGFHSHNNLQLSYSNAMALLEFPTNRNLMLDASVMGMGKGAGNLNTELLLEHLNLYYNKQYRISPLLELIDQVINVLHKEIYWGYSAEYYLSSINHCTPSYAGYFYNKHMLSIDQLSELLGMIEEEKKLSFDKAYAEQLYLEYNASKKSDDSVVVEHLKENLAKKKILLIAPGKSIINQKEVIQKLLDDKEIISISLNNFEFATDYVLITRKDMYKEAIKRKRKIIVPSNIGVSSENVNVINYERWILKKEKTYDSSSVIALMLLEYIGVDEIKLAGFDGFSININENYYDSSLRKPVLEEQASIRNMFYKEFIHKVSNNIKIDFLTPSMYE